MLGPYDPSIDLSIIIVNWNTQSLLHDCLSSIQEAADPIRCEIIVVDNGSRDGSAGMVDRDFPSVRLVVNERNRGFAAANNQGLEVARGRCLLLLNSDTIVRPNAMTNMVRYMDAHARVGVVGPRLLNEDRSLQVSVYPFPHVIRDSLVILEINRWPVVGSLTRWYGRRRDEGMSAGTDEVPWVMGACLLSRRSALENVGVLDDNYFFNAEEMDLCYRMRRHGWPTVYLPDAEIIHLGGRSRARLTAAHLNWFYIGKLRFYRLYYPRWQYAVLRTVLALSAAGHIVALLSWQRRSPNARSLLSAYARILMRATSRTRQEAT